VLPAFLVARNTSPNVPSPILSSKVYRFIIMIRFLVKYNASYYVHIMCCDFLFFIVIVRSMIDC
jgi:hypothetical protein